MSYAAPRGLPQSSSSNTQVDAEIEHDPPPAYTPQATSGGQGHTSLDSGPSRPDFSGPPPMPERLEHNITGVGVGYGPGRHQAMNAQSTGGSGWGITPQHTNWQPTQTNQNTSQTDVSPSPTEIPTPGRPLLYKGQLLVYPKGFWCETCKNTGYSGADPSNPHESDWRKYGKHYSSALAHSYTVSTNSNQNASTSSSTNFQRPLPSFSPAGIPPNTSSSSYNHNPHSHLPPPPSQGAQGGKEKWGNLPPPPPPPPLQHQYSQQMFHPHQPQQIFVQSTPGPVPPGALVVLPGDPRIGGRLCHRCRGSGKEFSFFGFGFDDGRCEACRGLGRLF